MFAHDLEYPVDVMRVIILIKIFLTNRDDSSYMMSKIVPPARRISILFLLIVILINIDEIYETAIQLCVLNNNLFFFTIIIQYKINYI